MEKKRNYRPWKMHEVALLKEVYPIKGAPEVARRLGRETQGVYNLASKLGLKRRSQTHWGDREIGYLIRKYPHERTSDIAKHLGRSEKEIANKASRLGIKKSAEYFKSGRATPFFSPERRQWTSREMIFLKARWNDTPVDDIARVLGRTLPSVTGAAHRAGLKKEGHTKPRRKRQTAEEALKEFRKSKVVLGEHFSDTYSCL